MALYVDRFVVLDTDYLVCASAAEGEESYDGRVFVMLSLDIGGKSKRLSVEYPDTQARDAALVALGACMAEELGRQTMDANDI